jgi:hypothetical protein
VYNFNLKFSRLFIRFENITSRINVGDWKMALKRIFATIPLCGNIFLALYLRLDSIKFSHKAALK